MRTRMDPIPLFGAPSATVALVVCLGIGPLTAQSSTRLVGRVTDAVTGASLVGVPVVVSGVSLPSRTDESGWYEVTVPAGGPHNLSVAVGVGYLPVSRDVLLTAGEELREDISVYWASHFFGEARPTLYEEPCRPGVTYAQRVHGGPIQERRRSIPGTTGSVTGVVSDSATGAPAKTAVVQSMACGRHTFVDSKGEYRLDSIPVGTRLIEVIGDSTTEPRFAFVAIASGRDVRRDFRLVKRSARFFDPGEVLPQGHPCGDIAVWDGVIAWSYELQVMWRDRLGLPLEARPHPVRNASACRVLTAVLFQYLRRYRVVEGWWLSRVGRQPDWEALSWGFLRVDDVVVARVVAASEGLGSVWVAIQEHNLEMSAFRVW